MNPGEIEALKFQALRDLRVPKVRNAVEAPA
jgi:hypothetical protein